MHRLHALLIRSIIAVTLVTLVPSASWADDSEPATSAQTSGDIADVTPTNGSSIERQESAAAAALNQALGKFNGWVASVLFFSVTGDLFDVPTVDADGKPVLDENGKPQVTPVGFPFIVFVLVAGGVFFTFFYRFVNLRAFRHAIDVVRGKFDRDDDEGDVSHFRALTSALSATVGLGNIAGVAIAIQIGGPGAVLWMMIAAFFGMSLKFNSCTLAQMYRRHNPDGSISGGPMYYLDLGLRKMGGEGSALAKLGKALGVTYALMVMGGSFGGGNMFQANQAFSAVTAGFDVSQESAGIFGLILAALVALVIIGGIQRIGAATARIVPAMVGIYVVASLFILALNFTQIPQSLALIFEMAFVKNAVFGGVVGVIVKGFQRASFSNEAGIGSAAIAHAAAKTGEPVREGVVAMLEPVIDTMVVCLMTATVVVITGAWNDPSLAKAEGVELTAAAFATEISWFPYVLAVCVLLFAYSTMISWAYYGERGWIYIVDHFAAGAGQRSLIGYRVIFVLFVWVGAVTKLEQVLNFSDLMILCMAFPNILGGAILAPRVQASLRKYLGQLQRGEFDLKPATPTKSS